MVAMLGQFATMLLAKIVAVVTWVGALAVAVFVAGWDLVRDAFTWGFEQLLDLVFALLGEFDFSALDQYANSAFGEIPADVLAVAQAVGIGPALSIIASALVIRILLQLIPFVRLGS